MHNRTIPQQHWLLRSVVTKHTVVFEARGVTQHKQYAPVVCNALKDWWLLTEFFSVLGIILRLLDRTHEDKTVLIRDD